MARRGPRAQTWHLYRDGRLVRDQQGDPRVFANQAEALWAGRHWIEFHLPTSAQLAALAEGDLRAERVTKGSGGVDAVV